MGRLVSISKTKKALIDNISDMIREQTGVSNYLITEQTVADKYNVSVEDIIFLEKEAIIFEIDEKNVKLRRVKILNNLLNNGLDFYKENKKGKNSDFTDAFIINEEGKLLFLLRNKQDDIGEGKYCLPGGHLEQSLSEERNVKKEIKEETGLDVLTCNSLTIKKINNGKNKIYYFVCTIPRNSEVILNEKEHSNYKWMSLEDLQKADDKDFIFDLRQYILNLLNK